MRMPGRSVYFPEIGWVEFEPTVSQPLILRPERDNPNPEADPSGCQPK
jgi:transglutaminase-like putative cysteine protease